MVGYLEIVPDQVFQVFGLHMCIWFTFPEALSYEITQFGITLALEHVFKICVLKMVHTAVFEDKQKLLVEEDSILGVPEELDAASELIEADLTESHQWLTQEL